MEWERMERGTGYKKNKLSYKNGMKSTVYSSLPPPYSISPRPSTPKLILWCLVPKRIKIRNTSCLASTTKTELPDTRASVINISCALALVPALSHYLFRAPFYASSREGGNRVRSSLLP
ncbi:hypothetical protein CEXT_309491 [Caerostris extrusa]|uniref:Uncharacterized protein n=1 Tax=Caerostris extrusa TaxID=172846 RepID=A0AAV4RI71_CAEEX|nr:hypothetical protein CEXT_309491 [Caerostris extrusa]